MAGYRLIPEARAELVAGVQFYDSEYPGLGKDFATEVRRLCRLIAEFPSAGIELRPGVRRRILRRFPYAILYTSDNDEILVLAIAHQKRRPGYWEEKAANLLYPIVKDHPFGDGNKRIGSFLFMLYLEQEGIARRFNGRGRKAIGRLSPW